MISKREVEKIAKLAKLKISKEELLKMEKDLSKILDYIEKLKKVELKEKKEKFESAFYKRRKDKEELLFQFEKEKILNGARERERNFFKVLKII